MCILLLLFPCRLSNVVGFYNELRCNIVMLEYRGYGLSQGSPSENGFYMDASAAMDFILTRNDLNLGRIVVFGRSLGNELFYHSFCKKKMQS